MGHLYKSFVLRGVGLICVRHGGPTTTRCHLAGGVIGGFYCFDCCRGAAPSSRVVARLLAPVALQVGGLLHVGEVCVGEWGFGGGNSETYHVWIRTDLSFAEQPVARVLSEVLGEVGSIRVASLAPRWR